jgi:Kdo2-lipid IVA lauroyltransferase/acyltransferase
MASRLASFASIILSRILKRERRIAFAQISFALPESNPEQIFKDSLYSAIMTSIEGFRIRELLASPRLTSDPHPARVSAGNLDILDEVKMNDTGAVCLTGHYGNFELMAAYFSLQGYPMTVIARKANDPVFQRVISDIRNDYGLEMLWREDPDTARKLIQAIRNKRYICALIDQDTSLENHFTEFFGLEAAHPISPIKLAVRFKKPVLFWSIHRDTQLRHHIHLSRIRWEELEAKHQEEFILESYSKLLEQEIRKNPGQWVWWHRRWRRRPGIDYSATPDKLVSTSEYISWISGLPKKWGQ